MDGRRATAPLRTLVVGGGIIGLLTALECARAGHRVTVVEQGPLPNPAASSYDRHRVLRALHPGDAGATRAALAAHDAWRELETSLGIRCYHPVGALTVLPDGRAEEAGRLLAAAGAPARILDGDQLAAAYPHLALPEGRAGILEERAGVLLADQVLTAVAARLRDHPGVRLCTGRAATGVDPAARTVTLQDGEVLRADRLLVAAGPWSPALLAPYPHGRVTVHRQTMLYCRVPEEERAAWDAMPAVPALGTDTGAWLVPPVAGAPLKLSAHEVCRTVPGVDGGTADPAYTGLLRERFSRLIPAFRPEWVTEARDCHYLTDTDSGDGLLLDLADGRCFAQAACGGGAFKFAPLIARALAQRFDGLRPPPTGLRTLDIPRRAGAGPTGTAIPTEGGGAGDQLRRQEVP
ncbi:NAD(P)/FAD-dependent oxidoreductase [Streptomyces natalensis]|uniref:NAD(P)/FAD-dependent oxidoreductase n=1 Tax=Streptomyces natalensis TaxID=68242 RepID=UPI001F52A54C|nr:FAD-dependent oxidoreductase [Streptomyces natalensis]